MPIDYSQVALTPKSSDTGNEMPAYMYAADGHNYSTGQFAITDPGTWGTGLDNAKKFVVAAAYSGVAGFVNTAVGVGNWMGGDYKEMDVAASLAEYDDDLSRYYQDNKSAVDIAGFVGGALLPGLGSVKLLNVGQKALRVASETGLVGSNLARATGLLAPSTEAYRTLAATEIAQSVATFSSLKGNAFKAIAAGYGQAALESFAFELGVAATMNKAPMLGDADGVDIAKNVLLGTVIGGGIGGAITHAVTVGGIKSAARSINPVDKLFTDTTATVGLTPAQKILARTNKINAMPEAPMAQEIAGGSFPGFETLLKNLTTTERQVAAENLSSKYTRMRTEAQTSMLLKNREDFHALTLGDTALGNQLADMSHGLDTFQLSNNLEHLTSVGRLSKELPEEKSLLKLAEDVDPEHRIGYVKLLGEDAGKISFDSPLVHNIADAFSKPEEVLREVKKFGFSTSKVWNPAEAAAKDTGHFEAEARYMWADKQMLKEGAVIGEHDIPLLERAIDLKLEGIFIQGQKEAYAISSADDLFKHVSLAKQEVAAELLQAKRAGVTISLDEIAKITNVRTKYLAGEVTDTFGDLFARQSAKAKYVDDLQKKGIYTKAREDAFDTQPTYAKVAYDTKVVRDVDGMEVAGMAYLKAQQKLYQGGVDAAVANAVPEELFQQMYHPDEGILLGADRFGGGAKLLTSANGNYGSVDSWVESLGSVTSRIKKHFKDQTTATLESSLYKAASKQEVAIEFESINKTIQSTAEHYGINESGTALEPLKIIDYRAKIAAGERDIRAPILQEGAPTIIEIKNADTLELINAHVSLTGKRTQTLQEVRNAQGLEDIKDTRAFRPVRPDPKDYPYYAVVVDPKITGVGHKSMIHATSAGDLEELIKKVPGQYKVYKGDELKQFFKNHGEFDHELTLHENYIDGDLKRSGVNNPFFIKTDPKKIVDSIIRDHSRGDEILARELVNAKYEKEFSFLRQQGEQFISTQTSKYTNKVTDLDNAADNPFINYIKTALDVGQGTNYPRLQGFNTWLDSTVSMGVRKIQDAWASAKSVEDLAEVNKHLNEFGVKSAYYDAATNLLANHTAPKGALTSFVAKANSILATLVTRTDPFNAINNAVGSTVLYGTELKSFLKAMGTDDTELAGKLSGLLKSNAPTSAGLKGEEQITSAGTIMRNAIKNFTDKEATTLSGKPLKEYYKANGWSTRLTDQYHLMLDNLALQGTEDVATLNSKITGAFTIAKELGNKAEKFSGNKLAEEFNRFVAADSMRQLTDLGVKAGKITEKEAISYINTFVNRTQGNILASQRPLIFQGAVGQAVGMFQSYQFNMMQQLFRHVAEGTKKDAAMLLGLQGTMYGMNGLPAFNFINTHIVGTASGNPNHQDLYNATYGIAGKSIGDLLLYGLPSNLLRGNLYTRGDINPRQVTVIPTNPLDIPFVNATLKMYDNVKNTFSNISGGGNIWQSFLQGIEHNGLSRPLAGLAQIAQTVNSGKVFSTNSKGTISGANDFLAWSTAVRFGGAKPIDDAIANDATFRFTVYQAADRNKADKLNRAIKTTGIGGEEASVEQIEKFAKGYAELGGKQHNFNKYMMKQIVSANTNKANAIMEGLKGPYNQKMQQIMGGSQLLDGRDFE